MSARNLAKYLLAGAASFTLALLFVMAVSRRSTPSDPRARVDRLISRCEDKMSEIEGSLAHIQAAVEAPA